MSRFHSAAAVASVVVVVAISIYLARLQVEPPDRKRRLLRVRERSQDGSLLNIHVAADFHPSGLSMSVAHKDLADALVHGLNKLNALQCYRPPLGSVLTCESERVNTNVLCSNVIVRLNVVCCDSELIPVLLAYSHGGRWCAAPVDGSIVEYPVIDDILEYVVSSSVCNL